jgi:AsmA protein
MRPLKITAYAVAALLGLLLVGVILVALLFDPNDYKADIEKLAQERLQRKLVLQGDLRLSYFPWLALELGPAQLGEREPFGSQPFVSVQQVRLSLKVWPLLRGQVAVGDVQLLGPSIRLITDAQGRHNWDDLTSDSRAADTAKESSGTIDASIAGISVQKGEVVLDDRREQTQTALHDFTLQARGIGAGRPFQLQSSFAVAQGARNIAARLAATVNADWNAKRYALTQFYLQSTVTGTDAPQAELPVAVRADTLALDMGKQTLQLTGLQLSVGAAQISGSLQGEEILDAPKFTGQVALAPLSLPEFFKQAHLDPPQTRDQVLQKLSFDSDLTATTSALELQNIKLQLDDTTASGRFGVADFKALALRFDLDVDRIDFDRYLPPQDPTKAEASAAKTSAPTPIPVDLLRTLNARGELRVGNAKFSGLNLQKLRIGIAARDGDVQIAPAQAALYGGSYRGDIGLNVAGRLPRLAFNAQVANVDFAPLLKDMVQSERLVGRGAFNAKLTASGADTAAMLADLDGTLDFKLADGAYVGMDLWYEIRRARAVFKQQPIPERAGAERTAFTAFQGTGVVRNGVLDNQDLQVAAQYLKIDGQGTVDLVRSTLDYRFNAQVLRIPREDADPGNLQELVDAEIPITASGPLASPKVRPDVQGYVKARAKQELNKEKDKLQKKLADKLRDLLRD